MTSPETAREFAKYDAKLSAHGLTAERGALLGLLDDRRAWNRRDSRTAVLERLFDALNINALLCARPAEPYRSLIDYLAATADGAIHPQDSETRTFLHDLPVVPRFEADALIPALKRRKSVIVPGQGIVTYGTVGLEQAFVTFACICFAGFVKFFADFLAHARQGRLDRRRCAAFERVVAHLDPVADPGEALRPGPFTSETQIVTAMDEAGKRVVAKRLVDSFFGNISYGTETTLYISQTGSSLDELPGCIDACPRDGSSCVSITASSELPTHLQLVARPGVRAILHGHPRFAVILSMDCDRQGCPDIGACHRRCPHPRAVGSIPIVPGEVGSGPFGLCHTVPRAMDGTDGVIVYGHGLFTTGAHDFDVPYRKLLAIENDCRAAYFDRLGEFGPAG